MDYVLNYNGACCFTARLRVFWFLFIKFSSTSQQFMRYLLSVLVSNKMMKLNYHNRFVYLLSQLCTFLLVNNNSSQIPYNIWTKNFTKWFIYSNFYFFINVFKTKTSTWFDWIIKLCTWLDTYQILSLCRNTQQSVSVFIATFFSNIQWTVVSVIQSNAYFLLIISLSRLEWLISNAKPIMA